MRWLLVLLVLLGTVGVRAQANEEALEAALAHWRAASWYVRIGNVDVAAVEIESFREKWPAAGVEAPAVATLSETASVALETNDPVTAGRSLAAIGDTLAEIRLRAGQAGFPEAMRDYRDAVERLSASWRMSELRRGTPFDETRRRAVRAAAAGTADAVARLSAVAPARWAADARFQDVLRQNRQGGDKLIAALERPAPPATGLEIAGEINVVRSNYHLTFLSYGY